MGHVGMVPDTFEWVVTGRPYVIVYEIEDERDEVVVLAVFHGRQNRQSDR